MEVIILAGGLGTRLRSEVKDVPKCMAPVAGGPFLWYLLKYLTKYENVTKVILSVGYLREVIFDWIDKVRNELPFQFEYAIEEEPLGTGGGIRLAMQHVTEPYAFVLNGDTYFDVDLNVLGNLHWLHKKPITLALKPMSRFDRYGRVDLQIKEDMGNMYGTILAFNEKAFCEEGLINGGVYCISRDTDVFMNKPLNFSFETAILEPQCQIKNLLGVVQNGYFIDIGIPEDYHKADREFLNLFNIK